MVDTAHRVDGEECRAQHGGHLASLGPLSSDVGSSWTAYVRVLSKIPLTAKGSVAAWPCTVYMLCTAQGAHEDASSSRKKSLLPVITHPPSGASFSNSHSGARSIWVLQEEVSKGRLDVREVDWGK